MSEMLVEVTDLSELDLEAAPPCEILFVNKDTKHEFRCGKPSVVRMRMTCSGCHRKRTLFLCRKCYDDLRKGRLSCWYCFSKTGKRTRSLNYQET